MNRFDTSTFGVAALFLIVAIITASRSDALSIVCLVGTGIVLGFCIGLDLERSR